MLCRARQVLLPSYSHLWKRNKRKVQITAVLTKKLKAKPSASQSTSLPLPDSVITVEYLRIRPLGSPSIQQHSAKWRSLPLRAHNLWGDAGHSLCQSITSCSSLAFQGKPSRCSTPAAALKHRVWFCKVCVSGNGFKRALSTGHWPHLQVSPARPIPPLGQWHWAQEMAETWVSCWDALHRLEAPGSVLSLLLLSIFCTFLGRRAGKEPLPSKGCRWSGKRTPNVSLSGLVLRPGPGSVGKTFLMQNHVLNKQSQPTKSPKHLMGQREGFCLLCTASYCLHAVLLQYWSPCFKKNPCVSLCNLVTYDIK